MGPTAQGQTLRLGKLRCAETRASLHYPDSRCDRAESGRGSRTRPRTGRTNLAEPPLPEVAVAVATLKPTSRLRGVLAARSARRGPEIPSRELAGRGREAARPGIGWGGGHPEAPSPHSRVPTAAPSLASLSAFLSPYFRKRLRLLPVWNAEERGRDA